MLSDLQGEARLTIIGYTRLKSRPDGLLREDIHGWRQIAVDDEYVDPMKVVDDEVKWWNEHYTSAVINELVWKEEKNNKIVHGVARRCVSK